MADVSAIWISPDAQVETVTGGPQILFGRGLYGSSQSWQNSMSIGDTILVWVFVLVSTSAWSNVFVHWTSSALPPAKELGLNDLVLSWNDSFSPQVKAARRQGYRVYVEVSLHQAAAAAETRRE